MPKYTSTAIKSNVINSVVLKVQLCLQELTVLGEYQNIYRPKVNTQV